MIDPFVLLDGEIAPPECLRRRTPTSTPLNAGGLYYVLSEEMSGGDQIYDQDTIVTPRIEATVPSAVYNTAPFLFVPVGSQGHAYGPVNIEY